jgi:hypothetical protein
VLAYRSAFLMPVALHRSLKGSGDTWEMIEIPAEVFRNKRAQLPAIRRVV